MKEDLEYISELSDTYLFGARFKKIRAKFISFKAIGEDSQMVAFTARAKTFDKERAIAILIEDDGMTFKVCDNSENLNFMNANTLFNKFVDVETHKIYDFFKQSKQYLDKDNKLDWNKRFTN